MAQDIPRKQFSYNLNPSSGKPDGFWRCRACASIWEGSKLLKDPTRTANVWLCGDVFLWWSGRCGSSSSSSSSSFFFHLPRSLSCDLFCSY